MIQPVSLTISQTITEMTPAQRRVVQEIPTKSVSELRDIRTLTLRALQRLSVCEPGYTVKLTAFGEKVRKELEWRAGKQIEPPGGEG